MEASIRHGRNFNAARARFESRASAVPSGFDIGRRSLSSDGVTGHNPTTTGLGSEPSPSGSNRSSRNDDEDRGSKGGMRGSPSTSGPNGSPGGGGVRQGKAANVGLKGEQFGQGELGSG